MGVKTKLDLNKINSYFKDYEFICSFYTKDGISDTVYLLKDKKSNYILKLYENSSFYEVEEEILILKSIEKLNVPRVLNYCKIYEKPLVLFSYNKSSKIKKITKKHLSQIGIFLKKLHHIKIDYLIHKSFNIDELITELHKQEFSCINQEFFLRYEYIKDLKLNNDTLIHADIFPDNVSFYDNKLNGVFDFAHSCISDRNIDLAIVIISWCFNNQKFDFELIDTFLNSYCNNIKLNDLKKYLLYVSLYFSIKRYINIINKNYKNVSYKEFIFIFDEIN
ncbi:phosphotransferase, partial [Arcobacter sp. CECT 8985]|uniref:phosphotransferase n=1 Tax=Arcobacter sp. CECT 8985 TaxID=1935424 RepID=UPI0010284408